MTGAIEWWGFKRGFCAYDVFPWLWCLLSFHDSIWALTHWGGPPIASLKTYLALSSNLLHRHICSLNINVSLVNIFVSYFLETPHVINILENTSSFFSFEGALEIFIWRIMSNFKNNKRSKAFPQFSWGTNVYQLPCSSVPELTKGCHFPRWKSCWNLMF